jgi:hypothetical protein
VAVRECEPAARVGVQVAVSDETATAEQTVVGPSLKVIVPVGWAGEVPVADRVAVKVGLAGRESGLALEVRVRVGVWVETAWVRVELMELESSELEEVKVATTA